VREDGTRPRRHRGARRQGAAPAPRFRTNGVQLRAPAPRRLLLPARKYRAAKDVMAFTSRGSRGGPSRQEQTSSGPQGPSVNQLHTPWEADDTATHDTVAVLPSGVPGLCTAGRALYARRETPTGPPLCYTCWTGGQRVPDCKILTDKQRDLVKAVRSTSIRQSNAGAGSASDRTPVVALVWDDLLGGADSSKTEKRDNLHVTTPEKWRRGAGNASGGWRPHFAQSPLSASPPRSPSVTSRLPPRG